MLQLSDGLKYNAYENKTNTIVKTETQKTQIEKETEYMQNMQNAKHISNQKH